MTLSSVGSPGRRRVLRGDDGHRATVARLVVPVPGPLSANPAASITEHLDDARREGYEAGYRDALAEVGAAEAAGRAAQLRRVADAVVDAARALTEERASAVRVAADEAVELAYQLAEALVQRELSTGRSGSDSVRRAVALAPSGHDLEVRIHPADAIEPGEIDSLLPGVEVKVIPDPAVEPGGCLLTAGPCRIDTQIGPALARARQIIAELRPAQRPAGEEVA